MSIFNSDIQTENPKTSIPGNQIDFESSEMALAAEVIRSGFDFDKNDVRTLANSSIISVEDAREISANMEAAVIKLDREMKRNVLHKKALVMLAKDKGDPNYRALLDLYAKKQKIFDTLESKYGQEARVNEGSIIGKMLAKIRGIKDADGTSKKISEFK